MEALNGFGTPAVPPPLTATQIQDLVRAQVRDELARLAAANVIVPNAGLSAGGRPSGT